MFDELGLSPSAGMLERFKLMGERTSQAAGAIEDIKYRLREKESIEGAYYCTYPSFVDVYHVFGRMMERTGMSVFLMLCTLNFINIETDDENQKYYSELLRESIQKAVRKGDFYTRYNIQQYLVMLIGITKDKKKHTGTFVVHVSHCDNATWQGEVTWAEANKKKSFRSALELIRLIDGALEVDE